MCEFGDRSTTTSTHLCRRPLLVTGNGHLSSDIRSQETVNGLMLSKYTKMQESKFIKNLPKKISNYQKACSAHFHQRRVPHS